jgi:hypothetical protein
MSSFSPVFTSAFDIDVRATFPTFFRVFRLHYDTCWLESSSSSTFVPLYHPAPHLSNLPNYFFFEPNRLSFMVLSLELALWRVVARSGEMAAIMVTRAYQG